MLSVIACGRIPADNLNDLLGFRGRTPLLASSDALDNCEGGTVLNHPRFDRRRLGWFELPQMLSWNFKPLLEIIRRHWTAYSKVARTLLWSLFLAAVLSVDASFARDIVSFASNEGPGTIVVRTGERRLYLLIGVGQAIRYPVGVGRSGKQWFGTTSIVGKAIRPPWSPPAEIRRGRPAWIIPAGHPKNPMGAAALVLADNELAIHGTNNPGSIGGLVSWGCIRMHNGDILDLYGRTSVGTRVIIGR